MAAEAILAFLQEHNRPFSSNEIHSGIKGKDEIGKAAVQKALNALVGKERIKEKTYGKQKIYWLAQHNELSTKKLNEKVLEMDREIHNIENKIKEVKGKIGSKRQTLCEIEKIISIEEAIDKKSKLKSEIENIKSQLEHFEGTEIICPKRKAEIEKEYDKCLNSYKKRKRMCMDMLNAILENYPKSKKDLFEEVGIETDEDVAFSLEKL